MTMKRATPDWSKLNILIRSISRRYIRNGYLQTELKDSVKVQVLGSFHRDSGLDHRGVDPLIVGGVGIPRIHPLLFVRPIVPEGELLDSIEQGIDVTAIVTVGVLVLDIEGIGVLGP